MVSKKLKRKLQNHDRDLGWENQMQSMLSISIDKVQHSQPHVATNLRRSVLIANMLRQARTHIEAIENPIKKIRNHHPATCSQQELAKPSGFEDMDDDLMEDLSLSTTITTIVTKLDTALDGSSGSSDPQQSPLASVENRTGDVTCRRSLSNHPQDSILDDLILD